jgi:hypothetical protein
MILELIFGFVLGYFFKAMLDAFIMIYRIRKGGKKNEKNKMGSRYIG